jgi:hypothetical protein
MSLQAKKVGMVITLFENEKKKQETVNVNPTHECMYVVVVGTLTW